MHHLVPVNLRRRTKAPEEESFDIERDGPMGTSLHVKFLSAGERDAFAPVGLIVGICFWFFTMV